MHGFFYNSSLKNYFNVITKLFSDIYVLRKSGEKTYLNRVVIGMVDETKNSKHRNKINSNTSAYNIARVNNVFPRINLKFVDMVPQTTFAVGSTVYINRYGEIQHSPLPLNMLIEMNIQTKSLNDSVMIAEQILPYFRPHFTIEMKEICGAKVINKRDVRLVLQTTSMSNDALGDMETEEVYDWSFIFEMVGFIYPPQISQTDIGGVIETVFLNFKNDLVSISEFDDVDELIPDFESVDIQSNEPDVETEEEWIESDQKVKVSRTQNIPVPEKEPSEIR